MFILKLYDTIASNMWSELRQQPEGHPVLNDLPPKQGSSFELWDITIILFLVLQNEENISFAITLQNSI